MKQLLVLVFLTSAIASGYAQQEKDRHHDVVTNRETVKQTEDSEWLGIGVITMNYMFSNLLNGDVWYTEEADLFRRTNEKGRDEYRVEFKGLKYKAERCVKGKWRWKIRAVDGYDYYFNVPDKPDKDKL